MRKLLFVILALMFGKAQAQNPCHLKDYWQKIYVLDTSMYRQRVHYYIDVKALPESHKCAPDINSHLTELQYIRSNFTGFKSKKEILKSIPDSVTRQRKLVDLLQKDTLCMQTVTRWGDAWQGKYPKDTVSLNTLMDIAAHFFYLDRQLTDGSLAGHVCTGLNALNSLQTERKPLVEPFVFRTIYDNFIGKSTGKYNLHDEYVKAVKEIYKIDLGKVNEHRLVLAQGAMLMYMFENEVLKSVLIEAYEKQKEHLPFVLEKE